MQPLPSADELLALARQRTGLETAIDPRFVTALTQLLESINQEAIYTDEGRDAAIERWLRLCCNRLRADADFEREPAILAQQLTPPLVISGLPRVGSTKLHQLLASTGDFQSLLFWQGFNPARRGADAAVDREARIADAVRFLEWRTRQNPRANAAHFMAAQEPEEDTYLLEYTLHTYWPITYFEVPRFLAWLHQQDREPAFGYVAKLLKYLQWQFRPNDPRPWVLKSPINLGYEGEMSRQLGGARVVMLHRDPVETIPSLVAIMRELRRLYGPGASDLKVCGAWAMEEYPRAMQRFLDWRDRQPPGVVLDIAYRDVRDRYTEVLERIYAFMGLALGERARQAAAGWVGDNEQHKHGLHQYTLDEAGLSAATIGRAFGPYIERYREYF